MCNCTLTDDNTGIKVSLSYDTDGMPIVYISTNFRCTNRPNLRPIAIIAIDGVTVYKPMDAKDMRWKEKK